MSDGSNLQRQVELLLRSDVNFYSSLDFRVKSGGGDGDLIFRGQQIRGDVEAVFICSDGSLHARGEIFDHDLSIRHFSPRRIGDGAGQSTSGNLSERRKNIDGQQ